MYILCVYIIHCFVIPPYLKLMSCIILYLRRGDDREVQRRDTYKKSISTCISIVES